MGKEGNVGPYGTKLQEIEGRESKGSAQHMVSGRTSEEVVEWVEVEKSRESESMRVWESDKRLYKAGPFSWMWGWK